MEETIKVNFTQSNLEKVIKKEQSLCSKYEEGTNFLFMYLLQYRYFEEDDLQKEKSRNEELLNSVKEIRKEEN